MKGRLKGSPSRVGFATPLAQRVFNALDCENPGIVSSAAAVFGRLANSRGTTYGLFSIQRVERALGQGVASIRTQ
jgi:hypothetical protein